MNTAIVVLILAYAMPGRVPDIAIKIDEPSLEVCWLEAKEFVDRGVPNVLKEKGAVGLYAGCRLPSEYSIDQ
jgi:hypothetical protein